MIDEKNATIALLKKRLKEIGIITSIVSLKLILSYFLPALKTPGELVWTGLILLIYTVKTFYTYNKILNC